MNFNVPEIAGVSLCKFWHFCVGFSANLTALISDLIYPSFLFTSFTPEKDKELFKDKSPEEIKELIKLKADIFAALGGYYKNNNKEKLKKNKKKGKFLFIFKFFPNLSSIIHFSFYFIAILTIIVTIIGVIEEIR